MSADDNPTPPRESTPMELALFKAISDFGHGAITGFTLRVHSDEHHPHQTELTAELALGRIPEANVEYRRGWVLGFRFVETYGKGDGKP